MIERSLVRIPAGAAGEFSSPGLTFSVDSYFGSVPPPSCSSSSQKIQVKVQVATVPKEGRSCSSAHMRSYF